MFNRFEWLTDEEESWELLPTGSAPETGERPVRRWTVVAAAAVATIGLVALLVLSLVNRQVQGASNELTDGVLASHLLVKRAIAEGDVDLFEATLSQNYESWTRLQIELFRKKLVLDRPSMNLATTNEGTRSDRAGDPQISLSPDLTSAVVVELQPYLIAPEDSNPVEIWLEQSSFYRRSGASWLRAPFPRGETFWGDWQREPGSLLTVIYPARDQEVARRLARDLSALVAQMCASPGLDCPKGFHLELFLDRSEWSLLDLNSNYPAVRLSGGYAPYRLTLPTPSLVGRPTSEDGYQALLRGYAGWLAAVLANRYGFGLSTTDPSGSIASILAQWGLKPPPPPRLPTFLPTSQKPAPPVPFPDQELLLVCQGHRPPRLLTYDPAGDVWSELEDAGKMPGMARLLASSHPPPRFPPDEQGFLIRRLWPAFGVPVWQSYLWLGGLEHTLRHENQSHIFLADPAQLQPGAEPDYLVFYRFSGDQGTPVAQPLLLDLDRCLEGNCELENASGQPTWTSGGEHVLLNDFAEPNRAVIYLARNVGSEAAEVASGYAPVWLTNRSFAFVRPPDGVNPARRESELIVAQIDDDGRPEHQSVVLNVRSLLAAIPASRRPDQLVVTSLIVHPEDRDWWFISATGAEGANVVDYVFSFHRDNARARLLLVPENRRLALPLSVSANGRFLAVLAFNEAERRTSGWEVIVLDLETQAGRPQAQRYETDSGYFDWSGDGNWLLLAENGRLHLAALGHHFEREVTHGLGCHTAGWID